MEAAAFLIPIAATEDIPATGLKAPIPAPEEAAHQDDSRLHHNKPSRHTA
jgi:hypothetical protein